MKVYFHRNKQESRWGSADNWAEYTALGEDVYYTTVYVNSIVDAPADIPVSTADPTDNLYFRYWGTQRYGDTSVIESYDFSAPVTGELHLYAFWDGPIELPVHVLDATYENIEQVDSWRKVEMINVHPGDNFTFSESAIAADYVNVPDGYAYAFTAIHNRTDNVQNITEDEEIIRVYYDHKENVLYVQYADSNKADAPLADTDEVYFVYYRAESLPIGYKLVNSDGSLTGRHDDTATGALGEFSMAGSITAPLTMGGYSNNNTTYFFLFYFLYNYAKDRKWYFLTIIQTNV